MTYRITTENLGSLFYRKTELLVSATSPEAAIHKARTHLKNKGVKGDPIKSVEKISEATIIR
jgi:hypothetical protein